MALSSVTYEIPEWMVLFTYKLTVYDLVFNMNTVANTLNQSVWVARWKLKEIDRPIFSAVICDSCTSLK